MGRVLRLFALWLALAAALSMVVGRHAIDYYRLTRHGVETQGITVAGRPHGQIEYTFEANARTYTGVGKRLEGTQIGDKIAVYYLPVAPNINCFGDPQALFSAEMPPVVLAVFLFPTLIILRLVLRRTTSRRVAT